MNPRVASLAQRILSGGASCAKDEALRLTDSEISAYDLLYWANRIREKFCGQEIKACSILSVRTGGCSEDCAFCAQSARHKTIAPVHDFLPVAAVARAAGDVKKSGAYAFSVVMSGYGPKNDHELQTLSDYLRAVGAVGGVEPHGGFGILNDAQVKQLKAAGLRCCNQNLETSRRFFPNICTTHTYDERVATLKALRANGVRICSGGLFGLGETWEDRIDLALDLRELDSQNVPMNFLNRIDGTPLADREPMSPWEILRAIAIYRFILHDRDIGVCGGREVNLRDLQALIFMAGANAIMVGNYLTTAGRSAELDIQMINDLGLRLKSS
ncbi:MAG: biotin synthase BioB [Planctomycetota bacterium]